MVLDPNITKEKNYPRIMATAPRKPTNDELIYLLKYKKFVDSPKVYSMCDLNEAATTKQILDDIISKNIPGCLVETGVWRGGMGMWMKSILKYYHSNRKIWLFDTFNYFPEPINSKDKNIHGLTKLIFENMPTISDVQNNFMKYGLMDKNIYLVQGEFSKTIPITNVGPIALLRLDSDYYESTMLVLEKYYWLVSNGGYIIIDDYNNEYLACKDAVDNFRKKYNITNPIIKSDFGSVYWQK